MEFEPKHSHIAYGDFSQLVGKANSKGVSIAETAKPLLFGAVGYCTAGAAKDELQIKVRDSAQQAWTDSWMGSKVRSSCKRTSGNGSEDGSLTQYKVSRFRL